MGLLARSRLALLGAYYMIRRARPWVLFVSWGIAYFIAYTILGVSRYFWYYAPLVPGFIALTGLGVAQLVAVLSGRSTNCVETNYAHTAGIGDNPAPVCWAGARRFAAGAATIPAGNLPGGGRVAPGKHPPKRQGGHAGSWDYRLLLATSHDRFRWSYPARRQPGSYRRVQPTMMRLSGLPGNTSRSTLWSMKVSFQSLKQVTSPSIAGY